MISYGYIGLATVDFTKIGLLIARNPGPGYYLIVGIDIALAPFKTQNSQGFFRSSLCHFTSRSLEKIYSSDNERKIVFLGRGSGVSAQQMNHIIEFRSKCYLHLSPWLLKGNHAEESFIDRMSYHVMALRRNRVYGVLRLTPFPFSTHRLTNFPMHLLEDKESFLEINAHASLRQDNKLEKMMLLMAAVHSFQNVKSEGLVTMSQASLSEKFIKLGMKENNEKIFLPEFENIPHSFLSTTFADLFSSPLKLL